MRWIMRQQWRSFGVRDGLSSNKAVSFELQSAEVKDRGQCVAAIFSERKIKIEKKCSVENMDFHISFRICILDLKENDI